MTKGTAPNPVLRHRDIHGKRYNNFFPVILSMELEALNLLFEKVSLTIEDAAITFSWFFAAITL